MLSITLNVTLSRELKAYFAVRTFASNDFISFLCNWVNILYALRWTETTRPTAYAYC